MAKSGLGRGLSALLGEQPLAAPQPNVEKGEKVEQIALKDLTPSPFQPRKHFSDEQLEELVGSIRKQGIIQPLIVRKVEGRYELIAGERRWRAAQKIGLPALPVIIRPASDREVLELALVENLQRADLGPLEEAEAFALLINQFKLTQDEVGQQVGKSRAAIANSLRLLSLPPSIRKWIESGRLSVGHAKVILSLGTSSEQELVAERVLKDHLTVRQTEKLVESLQGSVPNKKLKKARPIRSDAMLADLVKKLQRHLGTRVRLSGNAEAGKIELQYFSSEDFDRLLKLLGVPRD